jgi:hypothetical protein
MGSVRTPLDDRSVQSVHVIAMQVWAAPLGVDSQGAQLMCGFKTQGKPEFQDAVGAIAMRVCQVWRSLPMGNNSGARITH